MNAAPKTAAEQERALAMRSASAEMIQQSKLKGRFVRARLLPDTNGIAGRGLRLREGEVENGPPPGRHSVIEIPLGSGGIGEPFPALKIRGDTLAGLILQGIAELAEPYELLARIKAHPNSQAGVNAHHAEIEADRASTAPLDADGKDAVEIRAALPSILDPEGQKSLGINTSRGPLLDGESAVLPRAEAEALLRAGHVVRVTPPPEPTVEERVEERLRALEQKLLREQHSRDKK
jgi:hypothetical protein